ncbi:MAG: cyclic nucleotide-binding domain-containing protein, partial [Ignavibacteria bacterium]|nr:cyclic nucleotide-binding domain-containing protein [Ignavibacteria bacterium]
FYLIRAGRIALEIYVPEKGHVKIQTLEEDDILGWSWLIPPYRWHFDAKAIETVRAIAIDGKCLRRKCDDDVNLGYELFKRFSHIMESRVQALSLQVLDLYGTPAGGTFKK